MTRRARLATVAVLLAVTAVTACDDQESSEPASTQSSGQPSGQSSGVSSGRSAVSAADWHALPDVPLSPRLGPVTAWVSGRLVVVGGDDGPPCPPNADCASTGASRDGAVFDPGAGTWTATAPAPRDLADLARHAVVGRLLYVLDDDGLMVYDPTADSWSTMPVPGRHLAWRWPSVDGPRLVLASGSDELVDIADLVLDTRTAQWTRLPEDPLGTSFDRAVTATSEGLVLTAHRILPNGQPADPALVQAALLPPGARAWTTLPEGDLLGGGRWTWTGRQLVDPSPGGADGGEVNGYGREIPYAGRLDLESRTWSPLPGTPTEGERGGWPVEAWEGPRAAAAGWLWQEASSTWRELPSPAGAADQPGPATWGGDTLYVVGGSEQDPAEWTADEAYTNEVWSIRP